MQSQAIGEFQRELQLKPMYVLLFSYAYLQISKTLDAVGFDVLRSINEACFVQEDVQDANHAKHKFDVRVQSCLSSWAEKCGAISGVEVSTGERQTERKRERERERESRRRTHRGPLC